ncbi:MAG: energy-coupling factor transporter ATPase [Oscillospiraceae bacterium]|nr:energy-coupling factor transporter ATPase [Oscillospiraceae bacterium]
MADTIIEFQNVTFRYEGDEGIVLSPAVKDFSLKIGGGEFVAVLGHNGSGKSTLAKLANGLLLPESGDVLVDGMNTKNEDDDIKIKQTVGVVFQNPDNQIVATIVEEDVAFGPENLGIEQSEIRRRVDGALKIVGMYNYRRHEPHKLSGGQKQRVAIAGIIAMEPRCIILDEPTAMLDPVGRKDVMNAIKRLNREMGITVVYITHYMEEACEAQRIIVMDDAKLLMDGTPEEIFSDPEKIREIGLDVPQTCRLAEMLKNSGIKITGNVLGIDELVENIDSLLRGQQNVTSCN